MTITTYLLAVFLTATTSGLTDDAQSHPPQQEVLPAQAQVQAQNQTIIQARADLENAANQAGIDNKRLGTRLDELEARKTLNQLTDTQIVFAYQKLTELLTSTQNGPHFDIAQRKALVELVCHNLARPSSIDQGNHPTCNVTTLEVYLAARHPDIYADTIKQIVLTGKYTNWNNETITPPKTALMPGDDEKAYDMDIPPNNKRNHASQIMQMTLVNGLYETGRLHEQKDSKGNKIDTTGWRYIMVAPVKIYSYFGGYYGYTTEEDRLLDDKGVAQKGKDGKASTNPNVIGGDILSASEMMLGYKMPYLNAPYQITNQPWVYDLPTQQRLLDLKQNGKLPLGVHTFGGMHVQTIHDVVVENGVCFVLIDNQRGADQDGWITLDTLHKTMKSLNYQFKPSKTRS